MIALLVALITENITLKIRLAFVKMAIIVNPTLEKRKRHSLKLVASVMNRARLARKLELNAMNVHMIGK